jgi:DNA-binding Xre family transcriptional regulator
MAQAKAKTRAKPSAKKSGGDNRAAGLIDRKIGALMRARRLELGVAQQKLAADLGITFQQVQKYEKGVNRVAASTLIRVARALDCKITDLVPEDMG